MGFHGGMARFIGEALPTRWQRADLDDPLNVVILLRQALLATERAVHEVTDGLIREARSSSLTLTAAGADLVEDLDNALGALAQLWGDEIEADGWVTLMRALDALADAA